MRNFFLLALLITSPITLASQMASPQLERCIDAAAAVDSTIRECYQAEWGRQDQRLNRAYKNLLADLPKKKAAELVAVQRLWLKYSDAQCRYYWDADDRSGTLDRLVALRCAVEERARRADELEQLAE